MGDDAGGDEPDAKKARTAEEDMMARVMAFADAKLQAAREQEEKERLEAEQKEQREKEERERQEAAAIRAQEEAAAAKAAEEAKAAAEAIPSMDEAVEKDSGEPKESWEYMKPTMFQSTSFFDL